MASDRSFYGGEGPSGGAGGEISGGVYTGQGLGDFGAWKCPACMAENSGPLDAGCVACGSGSARARKVEQPPQPVVKPLSIPSPERDQLVELIREDMRQATRSMEQHAAIYSIAESWAEQHQHASLAEAFVAGYQLATQRTLQAPPVTADVATLAPAGKPRRTIRAALLYFRDQVLPVAQEEVAAGEWCTAEEIDALIQQFTDDEGDE